MSTQADPITRTIITGMALNNVNQAASLLQINQPDLALYHLNEAIRQLGELKIVSASALEKAAAVIELENASTHRQLLEAATVNDSTTHGRNPEGPA